MKVLVISNKHTVSCRIRSSLSSLGFSGYTELTFLDVSNPIIRQIVSDFDVIYVDMPSPMNDGIELLELVRPISAARIVAVGVPENPQQLLNVMHAGADAFVDESGNVRQQVRRICCAQPG